MPLGKIAMHIYPVKLLTFLWTVSATRRFEATGESHVLRGALSRHDFYQNDNKFASVKRTSRYFPKRDTSLEANKNTLRKTGSKLTKTSIDSIASNLKAIKELSDERAIRKMLYKGKKVLSMNKGRSMLLRNMKTLIRLLGRKAWSFDENPLVHQDIASAQRTTPGNLPPFDLGFIVDGSNVIEEQGSGNFKRLLEFVKEVLRIFPLSQQGVHTGLISYGLSAQVNFDFTAKYDHASVEMAIDSVTYIGTEPHIEMALDMAMKKLFPKSARQNVHHVLVIITGSSSTNDVGPAAEELRASGVDIFCVGVGMRFDHAQLDAIASAPSSVHVMTAQFDALATLVQTLASQITSAVNSNIGAPAEAPPPSLLSQGGLVEAKIDLGFLIDGSAAVTQQSYQLSLDFTKSIYEAFWTPFRSLHVGLIVFGATPHLIFDFDRTFTSTTEIDLAVDSAARPGGDCLAGEALKAAKSYLFGSKHSDSYKKVLVLVMGNAAVDDVFFGAEELQANSVTIFCVGAGTQYEEEQLEGIASPAGPQNVLLVDDYVQLSSLSQLLITKIEEDEMLDLAFLVDGSETTTKEGFDDAKTFVRNVYSNFPVSEDATHIALMIYGDTSPKLIFNLITHTDKKSVDSDLSRTPYPTYADNLLEKALENVKRDVFDVSARPGSHKVLVILASGTARDDVRAASRDLRDRGVITFVIGMGRDVDKDQLKMIASSPEKDHVVLLDPDCFDCALNHVVQNIRQAVSQRETNQGTVVVRMELGFLLDITQGTFIPENFDHVLNSVKALYNSFVIGPTKTRVGLVTYDDDDAIVVIPLDRYKSRVALDPAVKNLKLDSSFGPGSLGKGLLVARTQLFNGKTRPETPKILIVITSSEIGDEVNYPSVALREMNTTIFVIGVGNRIDRTQLDVVASKRPSEHVVEADITQRETAGENTASNIKGAVQVDLGFLVDGSSNVPKAQFTQLLQIVKLIYSAFPVSQDDIHVGMGVISSDPSIIFGFDTYMDKPSLDSAISTVPYPRDQPDANVGKAVMVAKEILYEKTSRRRVRQILVILIGGKSQDDFASPARTLRDSKIEIFVFVVGKEAESLDLTEMATTPPEYHVVTPDAGDLITGAKQLVDNLEIAKVESANPQLCLVPCPAPTPKPCQAPCPPTNVPTASVATRPPSVQPAAPSMCPAPCPTSRPLPTPKLCLAPCSLSNNTANQPPALTPCQSPCAGNAGKNTSQCENISMDLVILVDGCDMMNEEDFRNALEIAKNVYHAFTVSEQGTHVGLAVYGSKTEVLLGLQKYFDTSSVDETLKSVKKPGGVCLAGKALDAVKAGIFDDSARSSGVPNVLLHIMCGKSVDDVTDPSNALKRDGVLIVASGACAESSKLDLCMIGSLPMCQNAVMIKTFRPPEIPGKELACKIAESVPPTRNRPGGPNEGFPSAQIKPGRPTEAPSPYGGQLVSTTPLPSLELVNPLQYFGHVTDPYSMTQVSSPYGPHGGLQENTYYNAQCIDHDPICAIYITKGYCDGPAIGYSQSYLVSMCPKSCGICQRYNPASYPGIWIKKSVIAAKKTTLKRTRMFKNRNRDFNTRNRFLAKERKALRKYSLR